MTKRDHAQEITNQIIDLIEAGDLKSFECPWIDGGFAANLKSRKPYKGINVLLLWISTIKNNFTSNYWLTFKQAAELGGKVIKGSKGTVVTFFKKVDKDESGEDYYFVRKFFTIFNLDQIEGIDHPASNSVYAELDTDFRCDSLERILQAYLESNDIKLIGSTYAAYSPLHDQVLMPSNFKTREGFTSTLAHECVHSTGHPSRLARMEPSDPETYMKREAYAYEELVAELGAAFLCGEYGVNSEIKEHADYIDHWLNHLKGDKEFIFKAAAMAQKARDLICPEEVSEKADEEAA